MTEPPAKYRFGVRDRRALADIVSDRGFLSWNSGHNAAVVLCAHAEDALLRQRNDTPSDVYDRAMLTMSLARQWTTDEGETPVRAYCRMLSDIRTDEAKAASWHQAAERLAEGGQLHSSQPTRALELYTEALKLFEALGDEKGAGRSRGNIGLLLLNHQQVEDGVRECMAALELHLRVHYDRGCLMHFGNVLSAAEKLERWEDALNLSGDRLICALRSDPSGITAVHADAGWFALQLGKREDAESSYREAVAGLERVQTPAGFKRQLDSLGPLASALGHAAELQDELPRLQQQIMRNLQSLGVRQLAPSSTILDRFREAVDAGADERIFAALAQSESWSACAFERALAAHATDALINEESSAERWNALARRFGLAYCRSFLDRGPFDEYALYSRWTQDQRIIKARAYALKLTALKQATEDNAAEAHASLTAALELHRIVGDRDASSQWFPEAFRELSVAPQARAAMHQCMARGSYESSVGRLKDAERTLITLLELATRDGTTMDLADAYTRLGIHCAESQRADEATEWYMRAEQKFRTLELIGISVRDETGRAHNKLKMAVNLQEFLEQQGRYGEAALVGVAALREAEWFIGSFQHQTYMPRAVEYKTRMLHGLSRAYEGLGAYEKELAYADQMRAWSEQIGNRSALAAAHHSRAVAFRDLLNLTEALACSEADIEIQRELGNPREIATALVIYAEIAAELGDTVRASAAAREAIDQASQSDDGRTAKLDAWYVLARLAERQEQQLEAVRLYGDILTEQERLPGPNWIHAASMLAALLPDTDRRDEALPLAERAWEAAHEVQAPSLRLVAGCALATCLLLSAGTAGALQRAIGVMQECCGLVERIRGELTDESHRTAAAVAWVLPFEMLLSTLMIGTAIDPDPAWKQLAFEVAERAKARALVESIAASAAREAEAQGFSLGGLAVRPMDPREEIARAKFTELRDMLRREAGTTSSEPAAFA